MSITDILRFSLASLRGYRVRSGLTLFSMAIGAAAIVVLTSLGEGARLFVDSEFRALGTHLLIVLPGRSETTGGPPPLLGETPRDLTLDDAMALAKCRSVRRVAPVSFGTAPVSYGNREREISILGTTAEMLEIRHLKLDRGSFLPAGDPERPAPVCVIGPEVQTELFGSRSALGSWVRLGDRRFRVVGLLSSSGRSLGMDLHDMVLIPVASAMSVFDTASLFRVMVEARSETELEAAKQCILETIRSRHEGEDDVTVISQDAVLATFNDVLRALTLGVGGIAAISLAIAGILIMNVLLISVSERRAEIGLLKALGAQRRQIVVLFVTEGVLLSMSGGVLGIVLGALTVYVVGGIFPLFPVSIPLWAPVSALALAAIAGTAFAALPARRASRLDPVMALSRR